VLFFVLILPLTTLLPTAFLGLLLATFFGKKTIEANNRNEIRGLGKQNRNSMTHLRHGSKSGFSGVLTPFTSAFPFAAFRPISDQE